MKQRSMEDIIRIVDEIAEIPTLPAIATAIMQRGLDDNVNANQIARLVEKDQALAIKVLRLANSPFYRRIKEISTVSGAVVILGLNVLKSIVLSISVVNMFTEKDKNTIDLYRFWQHSISCAVAAKMMAMKVLPDLAEDAFMAGLLHDIAKVVIDQNICRNKEYAGVLKVMEKGGTDIIEVERDIVGIDHASLGKYLLERWNLPQLLTYSVGMHHSIAYGEIASSDTHRLCAVVHVADTVCNHLGLGITRNQAGFVDPGMLSSLGLTSQDIQDISISLKKNIDVISSELGIPKAEPKTYFEVLQVANARLGKLSLDLEQKKLALERRTVELSHLNQMSTLLQSSMKLTDIASIVTTHLLTAMECQKARCIVRLNKLRVMVTESFWIGDDISTRSGTMGATKELLERTNGIYPESSSTFYAPLKVDSKTIGILEAIYQKDGKVMDEAQKRLLLRTVGEVASQAIQRAILVTKNIKAQRLAAVSKTAIAANHEINSPLTTILLKVDMLQGLSAIKDKEALSALNTIKKEAFRIRDLVKKMLEISDVVDADYVGGEKMLDLKRAQDRPEREEDRKGDEKETEIIPGFEEYLE